MHIPNTAIEALKQLHERGAHYVLLRDKVAFWRRWQFRKPSLDVALHHYRETGGDLGIIPFSVWTSIIDVDSGGIGEFVKAEPPLVVLPTRRGNHLIYEDSEPRPNANGRFLYGCKVDVRGAKGYVRFHGNGPQCMERALANASCGFQECFVKPPVCPIRSLTHQRKRPHRSKAAARLLGRKRARRWIGRLSRSCLARGIRHFSIQLDFGLTVSIGDPTLATG